MSERRRLRWSELRERAHEAAAIAEEAKRDEADARALVAVVLDDEALLPEAIADWQEARRRLEVVEILEEVAFARLEADDVERDRYPVRA